MNREPKVQASRVNITKYVKVPTGTGAGWRFCPVVRSSNSRIRADYVLVEGRTEFHKEGAYYIEWYAAGKRHRESVGKNPLDAFAAAERKEQILKNAALGIQVVGEDNRKQVMLAEACQAFIDDTRLLKRPKTYSQYKTALEYFQESCLDKPLSSVDRTDLTRFMGFLAEQKQLESRTIWNKIQVVISMLKANGIIRLLLVRNGRKRKRQEILEQESVRVNLREPTEHPNDAPSTCAAHLGKRTEESISARDLLPVSTKARRNSSRKILITRSTPCAPPAARP
jgi:hypothetical protein